MAAYVEDTWKVNRKSGRCRVVFVLITTLTSSNTHGILFQGYHRQCAQAARPGRSGYQQETGC